MIYFDNAATTIFKPECVKDAVIAAMNGMGNSGRAAHGSALGASRVIYDAREKLADFFGCGSASNVVFTSNATEALNIAISGCFGPGDHIISTDLDHNSVLRPLYALEGRGAELSFLRADSLGRINYAELERLIRPNTKGIVCTHASNLTGNLVDIAETGRFAKKHGLIFIVDAAQTAGVFDIDMQSMNISILCFTGHKGLRGPQGTGGMCIAEGIDIRPLKSGGTGVQSYLKHQPKEYPARLEAGTLNGHGIAGLSAAVTYLKELGLDSIRSRETEHMQMFYDGIKDIPGITIYGDFSRERAAIVSFNWKDVSSGEIADALFSDYGIAVRPGAHCAPRMHEALGTVGQGAVRFSFGYDNTAEEVREAIRAVKELCV